MAKIYFKLIILLVALSGWVIYTNMDNIQRFINDIELASVSIGSSADPTPSHTTVIYQWQDADGVWHLSNQAPTHAVNVQRKIFSGN